MQYSPFADCKLKTACDLTCPFQLQTIQIDSYNTVDYKNFAIKNMLQYISTAFSLILVSGFASGGR